MSTQSNEMGADHKKTSIKASARFNADSVLCQDLKKPDGPISTGLGFLDHMIDQFNSHAQIGTKITIANFAADGEGEQATTATDDRNRHASYDQGKLMSLVGAKLGAEFQRLLQESSTAGTSSIFLCPLDEALVKCRLECTTGSSVAGALVDFSLAPYGKYPSPVGRSHVGRLETAQVEVFWNNVAIHSGLQISLRKLRGVNAHHIIESAFKAFSRALRNLLDGVDTNDNTPVNGEPTVAMTELERLYGRDSVNGKESIALQRTATVQRKTKETSIAVAIRLDGSEDGIRVNTGIQALDSFFVTLATNACVSLDLTCKGDLWIDEHHTAEDVAIAVGQVITQALGTKAGLNRMWCSTAVRGDAKIRVTVDLSNRPCLTHNLEAMEVAELVGDLSLEMFEHVLDSIVVNGRMTVHIEELQASTELHDVVQATAIAYGTALRYCAMVDSRRMGATASSKGTLSV